MRRYRIEVGFLRREEPPPEPTFKGFVGDWYIIIETDNLAMARFDDFSACVIKEPPWVTRFRRLRDPSHLTIVSLRQIKRRCVAGGSS